MDKERWFWFSQQQREVTTRRRHVDNVAQLDDGNCSIYTESTPVGHGPSGLWRDYIFVGKGVWKCQQPYVKS